MQTNLTEKQLENLKDLMCVLPDSYNKQVRQTIPNAVGDAYYFDCDMFDWQSEPVEPYIEKGFAKWRITYSIGYASQWYLEELGGMRQGTISIPAWLYNKFINGEYDYISWRKVMLE